MSSLLGSLYMTKASGARNYAQNTLPAFCTLTLRCRLHAPTEFCRAVQKCIVTEHDHPRDRGPTHTDGQHIQMAHTKGIPNNKGLHVSPRILCISLQGVKLHLNASEY